MAHNSVDLIEEDAADLQFPKDPGRNSIERADSNCQKQFFDITSNVSTNQNTHLNSYDKELNLYCDYCNIILCEPYIACAECQNVNECLSCFATGREFNNHRNDHAYFVKHDNFILFSKQWSALEEKQLLDSILRLGHGNWEDISKSVITKTPEECKDHYHQHYVESLASKLLPKFPKSKLHVEPSYLYNLENVEDPPRFAPSSANFSLLAGYRAARSDFDFPYDANAEKILSSVDLSGWNENDVNYDIVQEVHCAILRVYNHRLTERWRRYRIMRTHGLISPRKTAGWLSLLDQVVDMNAGSCLGKLMQLCDADNFHLLIEGLLFEAEMKRYLFSLYHLRENGVKSLAGGELYNTLKESREKRLRECSRPEDDPYSVYSLLRNPVIHGLTDSNTLLLPKDRALPNPRRKAVPLNILGMPGYDRLTTTERELCTAIRLIPEMYLTYRDQLISEYRNNGCLRLGDARKLIKIDVNKTRQIYDHLIKEGYINKPND